MPDRSALTLRSGASFEPDAPRPSYHDPHPVVRLDLDQETIDFLAENLPAQDGVTAICKALAETARRRTAKPAVVATDWSKPSWLSPSGAAKELGMDRFQVLDLCRKHGVTVHDNLIHMTALRAVLA